MQFHAQLADAIQAPTEFRLLNNGSPITVGRPEDREKKGLSSLFTVSIQDNKLLLSFLFYVSAKCMYICLYVGFGRFAQWTDSYMCAHSGGE